MTLRTTVSLMMLVTVPACDAGSQAVAPPAASPQALAGEPLGDPPPVVAEPATLPDRTTPETLLRSVIAARTDDQVPLAFLARAELATARKAQLDKIDEARAHRHFRMPAVTSMWTRIAEAVAAGKARFATDGPRATATFDVGGAMGTTTLSFENVDGQWYLALGN